MLRWSSSTAFLDQSSRALSFPNVPCRYWRSCCVAFPPSVAVICAGNCRRRRWLAPIMIELLRRAWEPSRQLETMRRISRPSMALMPRATTQHSTSMRSRGSTWRNSLCATSWALRRTKHHAESYVCCVCTWRNYGVARLCCQVVRAGHRELKDGEGKANQYFKHTTMQYNDAG